MRIVVARRLGGRGEGLGNEMMAWAKGFLASTVLHARLVGPSWGLNRRRYYRNFETSRCDFLLEDLLVHLPRHAFTEEDYAATGAVDFGSAIELWAQSRQLLGKRSYIVTVDGMYGGYPAIQLARPFLWSRLLNSRDALTNLCKLSSQLDPRKLFVAVHMRFGGDFVTLGEAEDARGRFNVRIPADWYTRICESLRAAFNNRVQFHFFTDRGGPEFDEAVACFNPGQSAQTGLTECSDLLMMANADLRVCSVSSYSLVASFLSDGFYTWYEPQLTLEEESYSLWGGEKNQRLPNSLTSRAGAEMRQLTSASNQEIPLKGYPVKRDGVLPQGLLCQLEDILARRNPAGNLLNYGVVPTWMMKGAERKLYQNCESS